MAGSERASPFSFVFTGPTSGEGISRHCSSRAGCIPALMIEQIDYHLWAGNLPAHPIPVKAPGDREEAPEEFEEEEKVRDPVDPPPARTGK